MNAHLVEDQEAPRRHRSIVLVAFVCAVALLCIVGCGLLGRWLYRYGLPERAALSAVPQYPGARLKESDWWNTGNVALNFLYTYHTDDSLEDVRNFYKQEANAEFAPSETNPNAFTSELSLDTPMLRYWSTPSTSEIWRNRLGPIHIYVTLEPAEVEAGTLIIIKIVTPTYRG